MGNSDHKALLINIMDRTMRIKRTVNVTMPFEKMLKKSDEKGLRLGKSLSDVFSINLVTKLI